MDTASICDARTSQFVIGTPYLKLVPRVSSLPSNFSQFRLFCWKDSQSWFKSNSTVRLQARQRFSTVFASNSTPSGGDSLQEKLDTKASDASQGPPFLTILAGFVFFVLVCWIVGSIVMWLTGLIVQLLKS